MVTASGPFVPKPLPHRPTCQIELPYSGMPFSVSAKRLKALGNYAQFRFFVHNLDEPAFGRSIKHAGAIKGTILYSTTTQMRGKFITVRDFIWPILRFLAHRNSALLLSMSASAVLADCLRSGPKRVAGPLKRSSASPKTKGCNLARLISQSRDRSSSWTGWRSVLRGAETDRRESRFAATHRQWDRRDGGAGRDDPQARPGKGGVRRQTRLYAGGEGDA